MSKEEYPDTAEDEFAEVPEAPDMPEPTDPSFDPSLTGEAKASRGKIGCLSALFLFAVAAAVTAYFLWEDQKTYDNWAAELKNAVALPSGQFEAALRKILKECQEEDILTQVAFELGEAGDKQAVPLLVETVAKGGALGREAARALARIGGDEAKAAVNVLFDQMNKVEPRETAEYAFALCMLGDTRGLGPLLKAASIGWTKRIPEYDPEVIARVASTDKLIETADSPDQAVRIYAAKELGFRKDRDPVPALLKLVKDSKQDVAAAAAVSLGRTADNRAGPALIEMMRAKPDTQDAIMTAITDAVGAIGLETVYNELKGQDEQARIVARLRTLRDPRSKDLLLRILKEAPESAADLREQALATLVVLGDKRIAEQMFAKTLWEPVTEAVIPDSQARYQENDLRRKAANEAVTWFGRVKPDGAADYTMKVYEANQPYSNTPECAMRVKADISQIIDAMGRLDDPRFCPIIAPFLDQDEKFYLGGAAVALSKIKCPKTMDDLMKRMVMTKEEKKENKFADLKVNPDIEMEPRLTERRIALFALRFMGDSKPAKALLEIILDTKDDIDLRQEAAETLAYLVDDKAIEDIIKKIRDEKLDVTVRALLIHCLWQKPTPAVTAAMMEILEGQGDAGLAPPAAVAVGEAADPALEERLNKLLDSPDEVRQQAAAFAVLLGGNTARMDRILEILKGQEAQLLLREWYEIHPLYLTQKMFESKAIFKRLAIADALAKAAAKSGAEDVSWAGKYLMQNLKSGWDASPGGPGGLTALEVRDLLSDAVRNDNEYRALAADVLAGLGESGYLLALQAEQGPQSIVARDVLRKTSAKSR